MDCAFSSPAFTNGTISGNYGQYGGGVNCIESSPTFTSCDISGNFGHSADDVCLFSSSQALRNCTIWGNSGATAGGLYCGWALSGPRLTNCTISGNRVLEGGGGVSCEGSSSPTLTNCIVWGNSWEFCCGRRSHCLTTEDPQFVSRGILDAGMYPDGRWTTLWIGDMESFLPDFIVEAPDFHLQPGSPAIEAGTLEGVPTTDIEGSPRPQGSGVDIGAYESPYTAPGGRIIPGDANGDGGLDISDAVATLGFLFLGSPKQLPCGDGSATDPANLKLVD